MNLEMNLRNVRDMLLDALDATYDDPAIVEDILDQAIGEVNDLMKVVREIAKVEQKIETARAFKRKDQIEEAVRRVLRQLSCIQTELSPRRGIKNVPADDISFETKYTLKRQPQI